MQESTTQAEGQAPAETPPAQSDSPLVSLTLEERVVASPGAGGTSAPGLDAAPGRAPAEEPETSADPGATTTGETATIATTETPTKDVVTFVNFFRPEGIPYAVVVLVLMTALAHFVTRESQKLGDRFADRRLVIQQTGSFLRFVVYLIGLAFAVLTLFEFSEQMMLAIGGSVAVAVGFAMKDLVASLVAGVIILMDRPFQVGDRITFAGYYGEVTHIGLRSVRLMTLDDTQVTVPNNKFLTDAVASGNAGAIDMMIQVDLYIGVDQDLEEARRLLSEVVTTSRYVNLNRNWNVLAAQVIQENYLAIRLRAKAYVLDARLEKAFQGDITERALEAFDDADVQPPAVLHRNVGAETVS